MKVLSITEPFATLILNGKKNIETRSWKTSYRGELYIHASLTKTFKQAKNDIELTELIKDKQLNYGLIICKCDLIDCIYMTNEYIEKIKNNNYQEYICGEYSEGRYAWVLDNVVPLEMPIKAKGQLSIWNYYSELEIMKLMKNIEYGWVDKKHNKYNFENENFLNDYILQEPKEIIKNQIGACWDQVELERFYFKVNDWDIKTYFLVYYDDNKYPTHTFLTFKKDGKYYWFEHSWERFRGIHEYNLLKDLLLDVKAKFIKYELNKNFIKDNIALYEYQKPKYHISVQDFINHCSSGKYIDIDEL